MFAHERFSRRRLWVTALAAVWVAAAGCGHGGAQEDDAEGSAPEPEPVAVHVQNRTWSDLTIYLLRSNTRIRLGFVTSMDTATFTLRNPWIRTGPLALLADPVGELAEFRTESLTLHPGDWVEWRVENTRSQSGVSIW